MFNNDIPKISPGLQVYKKYLISNAIVRLILVKCQTAELKIQWVWKPTCHVCIVVLHVAIWDWPDGDMARIDWLPIVPVAPDSFSPLFVVPSFLPTI